MLNLKSEDCNFCEIVIMKIKLKPFQLPNYEDNFFIFISCFMASVYSQGLLTVKGINVDFTGFVRNDFIFDSRRNLDACDDLFDYFH